MRQRWSIRCSPAGTAIRNGRLLLHTAEHRPSEICSMETVTQGAAVQERFSAEAMARRTRVVLDSLFAR